MPICPRCSCDIHPFGWPKHKASCKGGGPRRIRRLQGDKPCPKCGGVFNKRGWANHVRKCAGPLEKGPGKGWAKGTSLTREHREKISQALTGKPRTPLSPEAEQERRRKISEAMKAHPNGGGYRKGSGVGKGSWHDSPIAGRVWLDSSYELRVALYLDAGGIPWKRNWEKFPYEWRGKTHHYIPDFRVEEGYIEVKGYVSGRDRNKWRDFPHPLFVLLEEDIKELESGGIPKWS